MNDIQFKVLKLINDCSLDSACWGVVDDFNEIDFDIELPFIEHEGKYLYIWVAYEQLDFTFSEISWLLENSCLKLKVYTDTSKETLSGTYLFFELDSSHDD